MADVTHMQVSSRLVLKYETPIKPLTLLRPSTLDKIILPGDHIETLEFADFVRAMLDLGEDQIQFTLGASLQLDNDVLADTDLIDTLRSEIHDDAAANHILVPVAPTPSFQQWASELAGPNVGFFGDSTEWTAQFPTYGSMFPLFAEGTTSSAGLLSGLTGMSADVIVPRGFRCKNAAGLLKAYKLLGIKNVVIGSCTTGVETPVSAAASIRMYDVQPGVCG